MSKIMKTAEEFRQAAIKNNIDYWGVHNCSICGYECGYLFNIDDNKEHVAYDNGCDCTLRYIKRPSSWGDVAAFYNMQSNEEVIQKMNNFWGFKEATT